MRQQPPASLLAVAVISIASAWSTAALPAAAAAPAAAQGCNGCHGANGVSGSADDPTIAGLSEDYLEGEMNAYRSGSRSCTPASASDMCTMAKQASAAEVKSTAAWFATQPFVAARQTTDPALVPRGKALHEKRCAACHSGGGSEASDDAGILAGQWQAYLESTLRAFQAGTRPQPAPMHSQTASLSPDDIHALAEFYASEGPK
jgi:sulfide dehydrogenase cytochrome subunit